MTTKTEKKTKTVLRNMLYDVCVGLYAGLKTVYVLGRYAMPAVVWGIAVQVGLITSSWAATAIGVLFVAGAVVSFVMNEVM